MAGSVHHSAALFADASRLIKEISFLFFSFSLLLINGETAKLDAVKTYMRMRRVPQHLQVKVIKWFDYLWFTQKSSDEEKAVGGLPGTYNLNGFSFVYRPPGCVGLSPFASLRLRRVPVHVSLLLNKSPTNSTQIKWGAEQRKRVVNNPALGFKTGVSCVLS